MIDAGEFDDLLREGMAEHTRDLVIPPGSAERALRRARRGQQTRLTAMASLTVVLAVATPAALHLLPGSPQPGVSVRPAAGHTFAAVSSPGVRKPGPGLSRRCGGTAALPSAVPTGPVTVVATAPDGDQEVMWVSTDAELFLGERVGGHGAITPLTSTPMNELKCRPGMFMFFADGGPAQANTPVVTILFGAVRGRPSRILAHLPGADVPAHLVTAPGQLGTLFWLTSKAFTGNGDVANPKAARSFGTGTEDSIVLTVYDGQHARLHCTLMTSC